MKNHCLYLILLFCFETYAQDINFSQHWNAPTQFDVAKPASINHLQTGIQYRSQWPEALNSYRTYAGHVVYPLIKESLNNSQFGAVALEYVSDASGLGGIYKKNQIKGTVNYKTALSKYYNLSFGLRGGNTWSALTTEGLTSGNQYQNGAYQSGSALGETFENVSASMFTLDAGIRLSNNDREKENWYVSASLYNVGRSTYGFSAKETYPSRLSIAGGSVLLETSYFKITPNFLYQRQSTSALTVVGSNFYYKIDQSPPRGLGSTNLIGMGLFSRIQHDLIVAAEIKQENFSVGLSYDFHANKNSLRPTSSFEIFLSYDIAVKPRDWKIVDFKKKVVPEELSYAPDLKMRKELPKPEIKTTAIDSNLTIVEIKLLDPELKVKSTDTEITFQNLDDTTDTRHEKSYNRDSTAFIAYLSKNTNFAITIKRAGFYNKTLKFNTGQRDSLAIPNKLKLIVLGEVLVLSKIHFKSGVDELNPSSEPELISLVNFLTEYPNIIAEISGHTDNLGSADLNLLLSQKRAEAIVNYLVIRDIDKKRLVARGFGESKPLVPNDSDENRAKNRRVELKIIGK